MAADTDTTPNNRCYAEGLKPSGSHNWAAHMFPISPVDWSWSGTVSGFDPGVLLESWGRVAPSCPGTITTALVFGGTGRDFSGVGAGGLAADGGDPSRACPSTISRELARTGGRLGYRGLSPIGQRYSEPDAPKHRNSLNIGGLDGIVEEKLEEWWSSAVNKPHAFSINPASVSGVAGLERDSTRSKVKKPLLNF